MLGIHQSTYDALFEHPISRSLQWRDVRSMLSSLSHETDNGGEALKFTRNGKTLFVRPPRRRDFSDVAELMRVRRFLDESDPPPPSAAVQGVAAGMHLLVVIDHRLARIYKTEFHGAVPERIVPYDASGAGRHLHRVDSDDAGNTHDRDDRGFYAAVAMTLGRAEKILLFGSGSSAMGAMNSVVDELKRHDPEVSGRLIGSVVVDEQHLTEDHLLARAREVYAAVENSDAFSS